MRGETAAASSSFKGCAHWNLSESAPIFVMLDGFRIAEETLIWVCLWTCFQEHLSEVRRNAPPWKQAIHFMGLGFLLHKLKEMRWGRTCSSLCFLTVDARSNLPCLWPWFPCLGQKCPIVPSLGCFVGYLCHSKEESDIQKPWLCKAPIPQRCAQRGAQRVGRRPLWKGPADLGMSKE